MNVPKQTISDKDIETALYSVAQLIDTFGDKYWPVFERLEEELNIRRSRSERLNVAMNQSNIAKPKKSL